MKKIMIVVCDLFRPISFFFIKKCDKILFGFSCKIELRKRNNGLKRTKNQVLLRNIYSYWRNYICYERNDIC